MVSFAMQRLLSLIRSHLFIFAFISFALWRQIQKNIAVIYVKECSTYVFLSEFYSICIWSYVLVFNPVWVYFCVWIGECSDYFLLDIAVQFC